MSRPETYKGLQGAGLGGVGGKVEGGCICSQSSREVHHINHEAACDGRLSAFLPFNLFLFTFHFTA